MTKQFTPHEQMETVHIKTSCSSPVPLNVNITAAIHTAPQDDVIARYNLARRVWSLQLHQDWFAQPCNTQQIRHRAPRSIDSVFSNRSSRELDCFRDIRKLYTSCLKR